MFHSLYKDSGLGQWLEDSARHEAKTEKSVAWRLSRWTGSITEHDSRGVWLEPETPAPRLHQRPGVLDPRRGERVRA